MRRGAAVVRGMRRGVSGVLRDPAGRFYEIQPVRPEHTATSGLPARAAQETFRRVAEQTEAPAGRMAGELLDTAPLR